MLAPRIGPRILNAADEAIALSVRGLAGVALQLVASTLGDVHGVWSGTVSFEATVDGQTWVALNMVPSNSATAASSATGSGVWSANVGGYDVVRARASSYTAGQMTAWLQGTEGAGRF